MLREKEAFTLLELMISLLLISVLVGISFHSYQWMAERARATEATEILSKAYEGFQRLVIDDEVPNPRTGLTWRKLGLPDNPNADPNRHFDYNLDFVAMFTTRVNATRRNNASRWLWIDLDTGTMQRTPPY